MGYFDPSAGPRKDFIEPSESTRTVDPSRSSTHSSEPHAPFHTQLEYLSQPSNPMPPSTGPYGPSHFDMSALATALPAYLHGRGVPRAERDADGLPVYFPGSVYQMPPAGPFAAQRAPSGDAAVVRGQHPPFVPPQFPLARPGHHAPAPRPQNSPPHSQSHFPPVDVYGYGVGASSQFPLDVRFGPQTYVMGAGAAPMGSDINQFARRTSESGPVPSFPRGPPRKPKQSGHALWVGNLPPAANVTDLKDHFSRDATKEIESLFLISKSNCAFVNYRTEAACVAAMNRFHDSRFHGVRLVCRLRRGSSPSASSPPALEASKASSSPRSLPESAGDPVPSDAPSSPVIVGLSRAEPDADAVPELTSSDTTPSSSAEMARLPDKYFIVKSLTVQDLESSVRNGTWATQSHNEDALNRAFQEAENVYLIFSANKSGEYFGYARMASPISGEPVSLGTPADAEDVKFAGSPQSIPTPATGTAPKGRIIDDSARGTIFWEADASDDEPESSPQRGRAPEDRDGQNWGRQFKIEWVSTARLPFFRTRGLRNPWNANREVKIARDGTELEPSVGRRLVQMFQRPAPSPPGVPMMVSAGPKYNTSYMPYALNTWAKDAMMGNWQRASA